MTHKRTRRKVWAAVLSVTLGLFALQASAGAATKPTTVKVESRAADLVFDGQKLAIPNNQYIFMVNGTNYVPVRFTGYALQKNVQWDPVTKTVTVKDPTELEAKTLKEYLMNAVIQDNVSSAKGGTKLTITPVQAKFVFDGKVVTLPKGQSVYNLNGSIYIPVRFMSESVGTEIKWDGKSGKISAESPAYKKQQEENANPNNPNPNNPDGQQPGTNPGGTPGGTTPGAKPTYESITSSTEQQLRSLESTCTTNLMNIVTSSASGTQKKTDLDNTLSQCKSQFNSIVNGAEQQLTSNGYSTAIIAEYRSYFEQQLKAGEDLLKALLGQP